MNELPKRSRGFTLVELIIVTMLSGIVFAGLASLYAEAFRSEIQTFRQTKLQASATLIEQLLQRDLAEATYIILPAEPVAGPMTGNVLQGFKNYVCLGSQNVGTNGCGAGWQQVGTQPPTEFFFVYCPAQSTLTYYEVQTTTWINPPPGCPSPATFGSPAAAAVYLVESPPLIFQQIPANPPGIPVSPPIFSRPPAVQSGTTIGGGHHTVDVQFELDYVSIPGVPPVPNIDVDTEITTNEAYLQP
jgi:prepilin-type N-terminal cleavage/methylation domain-containing protein